MPESPAQPYPYPGLRPFRRGEADIFFGREQQVDQLLGKLHGGRFVAVVGTSGCGKSSLLNAGLIPALETGFMPSAGARWRVIRIQPGLDPMRRLATALFGVLEAPTGLGQLDAYASLYATLQRGPLGLRDALAENHFPARTNLLVIVDQFEEIFRYRREQHGDEANAFVALLLASAAQAQASVYVVLAMRSERLGDCAVFSGLPEAINESIFLIPRLTREQRQVAIVGPARLYEADVEPALVNRLLNDMGADPDQLPLMQHALMRTWRQATAATTDRAVGVTLTVKDYDQVGGITRALSNHADKAFAELSGEQQRIAEVMFRRLTNEGTGLRDTRRLASIEEVAQVAAVSVAEVNQVVEAFRRPGREFLTLSMVTMGPVLGPPESSRDPSVQEPPPETILDISHESLIRQWGRLTAWVEEEAKVADNYRRLHYTAHLWKEGKAAPWGPPDLDVALEWKARERPNAAWAKRYGGDFELAMQFIDASEAKRQEDQEAARRLAQAARQHEEDERRRELGRVHAFAEEQRKAADAERLRADVEQRAAATLRRRAWILGGVGVVCCVLAVLSYLLYREARDNAAESKLRTQEARANLQAAISHKLAARANEYANEQRDLALLLSVQAQREQNSAEARSSLLKIVGSNLRIGRFLHGREPVTSIAFGRDGGRLASASQNGRLWTWDVSSATSSESPISGVGDGSTVTSVALSADGGLLAMGLSDGSLRVVHVGGQRPDLTLKGLAAAVRSVALSPDASRIAGGTDDGAIAVWRTGDGALLGSAQNSREGPVRSAAFSPDNQKVAWGSEGGSIRVWSIRKRDPAVLLEGHTQPVLSLVFDRSAAVLASGSADQRVRLWDVGTRRSTILVGHTAPVRSVAFRADGAALASGSDDGTARVWHPEKPDSPPLILAGHAGRVLSVAFAPDGTLASGGTDASIILWRTRGNPSLGERTPIGEGTIEGRNVALSADGRKLTVGSEKGIRLWDLRTGGSQSQPLQSPTDSVSSVAINADGSKLASGNRDGTVVVWDVATGRPGEPFSGSSGMVMSLSFSPDGKRVASGDVNGIVRVWDIERRSFSEAPRGHSGPVLSLAFSPDGSSLASGGRDWTIQLWERTATNASSRELPKGHLAAVTSLAFSPDGRKLASGSADETVRVWSLGVAPAEPVVLRARNARRVSSIVFFDQDVLVSGAVDGTIRLWDIATRHPLGLPLEGHKGPILGFTLRANDGALVSVGDDEGAGVGIAAWRVDPQSLRRLACTMANRELSEEEWKEHVGEKPRTAPTCADAAVVPRGPEPPAADGWLGRLRQWFKLRES